MRTAGVVLLILGSGCTVTSQTTRRVAFSTVPTAPRGLSGGSGVALTLTGLAGIPEAKGAGSAVAFPMFQPDLGATVQLGARSYVGGRLALATAGMGAGSPPGELPVPTASAAFDLGLGGGHDLPLTPLVGVSLSGEIGLSGASLTTEAGITETHLVLLPSGRVAAGVYFTPGAFRIYAGGTVGTSTTNDGTSTRTTDCRILPCSLSETGHVTVSGVAMLGGGARWQASPLASVGIEGWVPLTEVGLRLPFMFAISVRLGDFVVRPRQRAAPEPPPVPPPEPPGPLTPDPEVPPPQL